MEYGLGGNFDFGTAIGESAAKKKLALKAGLGIASQAAGGQQSAAGGAVAGATAGMAAGPVGAAIGGVVGGISGGLQAKATKKKADAQADADRYNKEAQIESQTQLRRSAAIQSLAQNIGNTLLR